MAKFQFVGVDELIAEYNKIYDNTEEMIGKAVYQGAGVVFQSIKDAVDAINTDDSHEYGTAMNMAQLIIPKEDLHQFRKKVSNIHSVLPRCVMTEVFGTSR